MAQTSDEALESMKAGIAEKTGKPLDHWVKIVKSSGLEKHGEQMSFHKTEHGMTHG